MKTPNADDFIEAVRDAGIVGAGGAGFPTYRKIDTRADLVIANGAECEPLLYKDQSVMVCHPTEMLDGLNRLMRHTGAARGVVAIKGKNRAAIAALTPHLRAQVTILEMDDVYPAGDEYEIVYSATGRRIPAGGYPSEIGVLVQNVETLFNVHRASQGHPVTHSFVTIHGHVAKPQTVCLPIGTSFADAVAVAGGATIDEFVIADGGPMMGRITSDLSAPLTRLTSGLAVIARDSALAARKMRTEQASKRVGKSACDQCCLCTEMCPRYLLGYHVRPHMVMRSLLVSGVASTTLSHWAQGCCACNVCSFWACPEGLDPGRICAEVKRNMSQSGSRSEPDELKATTRDVHRLKAFRGVPTDRLARRLGLDEFAAEAPFVGCDFVPDKVTIPLKQHAGTSAVPIVSPGDMVNVGDVVAKPADDGSSVPVHASIAGMVRSVDDSIEILRQSI